MTLAYIVAGSFGSMAVQATGLPKSKRIFHVAPPSSEYAMSPPP
jgi:hypothetical protein